VDSDHLERIDRRLTRLLWPLQGSEVVDALAVANEAGELSAAVEGSATNQILRWLADHRHAVPPAQEGFQPGNSETLRGLPIFPSARGPLPLAELQLPGPFDSDPLEITKTVDLRGIDDLREFLGEGC